MLAWSSNISIIFIVNSKTAFVFEIELRMKNHCGESVGFSFSAALWFGSDFVYVKFLRPMSLGGGSGYLG